MLRASCLCAVDASYLCVVGVFVFCWGGFGPTMGAREKVVRTVVFSSARSDTDKESARMQMFNAMREQNFEVHMATTMGVQEKCIDIALAVEMMHYATIPDTYDVGGEMKRATSARKHEAFTERKAD